MLEVGVADEVMGSVAAAGVGWGWPSEAYEAWIYLEDSRGDRW